MAKTPTIWKPGRGVLGALRPLFGAWQHEGPTKLGLTRCRRVFEPVLGNRFIRLQATWLTEGKSYEEIALFGAGKDNELTFWSFTSQGGPTSGTRAALPETCPEGLCFEADMPAGRGRMLYWPQGPDGFVFAVEARGKAGWNRFLEQQFTRDPG